MSYDTRSLLARCLASLEADVEAGRAEVWVVDNGSTDGSPQLARERAPWARVIEAEENLGFGRAVNLVASRTATPWVAAANADVALQEGALAAMLAAGADPAVGCVAPRLILPDGRTQHSVHSLPTIPFTVALNLGLAQLIPGLGRRLRLEGRWDPDRPRDGGWAIGAFVLLRRAALAQVGGFDERQWLYAEDLDLGWRLRAGAWRLRYVPGARVEHQAGAATGPAFGEQVIDRYTREALRSLRRRRGRVRATITALINLAGAVARWGWMAAPARASERWRWRRDQARRWMIAHGRSLPALAEWERR